MRALTATIVVVLLLPGVCASDTIEVIDLLHLDAREFAASLSGGGRATTETLEAEAADFAVAAMREAANRTHGRMGAPDPFAVSRARSVPGARQDMSALLPEGLSAPPVAAPNRNALVVRGEPEAIDRLRELITMLDVPTAMVNVEVAMDEVSTLESRELEAKLQAWGDSAQVRVGDVRQPILGFTIGDLRATLGYESVDTRRNTMTAAHITGMSGSPMVISAGEVRPWIATAVYYDPWGRRHVEYYPRAAFVGVSLWVLPTVNPDRSVTMRLRPTISEVVGPAAQVGAGDVIRRTLTETTVRVADGQSLVIGGVDRRLDEISRSFPLEVARTRGEYSSALTVTPRIIRPTEGSPQP